MILRYRVLEFAKIVPEFFCVLIPFGQLQFKGQHHVMVGELHVCVIQKLIAGILIFLTGIGAGKVDGPFRRGPQMGTAFLQ